MLDAIEGFGVTTMYAPPTLIYGMVGEPTAGERDYPIAASPDLLGRADASPTRFERRSACSGAVVETAYGQVEAPQIITAMRAAELRAG